jgi:GNAT superfamily N-acetyltransferase
VRDDSGVPIEFRNVDAGVPPASDLVAAMVAEMDVLYGTSIETGPSATPADCAPPGGAFLVGFQDGAPVCAGGLKPLAGHAVEIKRMYVVEPERGRGVARALLKALEDAARDLGYDVVRFDTGARQPHVRALFESSGYAEIGDYNGNPFAAFWGEKLLGRP